MTLKPSTMLTVALMLFGVAFASVALAQAPNVSIFVGPQLREGFVDIDSGIRDSIRDIQAELRTHANFTLAEGRETATIVVIVLARGIVTNGSVGFSSSSVVAGSGSGFGFVMPNTVPTLSTLLRVGRYERVMQSEGPTWSRAAKTVVEDLVAWCDANRRALQDLK